MEQNDLVAVAVPAGFQAGQTLTVTSPSGVTAHVVIPQGIAAGSTFTASIPKPTPTVVAVAEAVPVVVVEVEMGRPKAAYPTSSTTTTTTTTPTTAANGPVPRLCCHVCSYILAGLMFICGVISVILLWTALALDNGQIVGYVSACTDYELLKFSFFQICLPACLPACLPFSFSVVVSLAIAPHLITPLKISDFGTIWIFPDNIRRPGTVSRRLCWLQL